MKTKFIICIVLLSSSVVFSQTNKGGQTKAKVTSTNKTTSNKSPQKKTNGKPAIKEVPIPYNSNDCLFAIDIFPDTTFGPTTAPKGGGRVMEIMRDPYNSNLFEYEHNSTWYRLQAPYSGKLVFEITPMDPTDDYDFLLFKYTDQYFCNRVASKKIQPLLSNLSIPDSTRKGKIGASEKGTKTIIGKSSTEAYTASIEATKGDVYYLVLDNNAAIGKGHSMKYSVFVDFFKPKLHIFDSKDKKQVSADVFLVEKSSENRVLLNRKDFKGGELKLVPGFEYALYIKKEGYFSVYEDFNSNRFLTDTSLRIQMVRIERGAVLPVHNISFEEGYTKLLPSSDSSLLEFVQMFKNHLEVNFEIKGYIQSYGFDEERDMNLSLERAVSVMRFFADNGISTERMSAIGMSKKEIKVMSNEILNKNKPFTDKKIEIIIKSVDPTKKLD